MEESKSSVSYGAEEWSVDSPEDSGETGSYTSEDFEEAVKKDHLNTSKELQFVPLDWDGWQRGEKIQYLVEVIQYQLQKVRSGNFDLSKSERVAALALEAHIELSDVFAEAESLARDAKNEAEYTEGEVAADIKVEVTKRGNKISEAALKREATIAQKVKKARKNMIALEREHKKYKYVYDMLKEAHIFFRNLAKP